MGARGPSGRRRTAEYEISRSPTSRSGSAPFALAGARAPSAARPSGEDGIVRPSRCDHEKIVEDQSARGNGSFGHCIRDEQVTPATHEVRREGRSERQPPHEDGHDERLRVSGMSEEELQVMRPDRFVDEAGESGRREETVEDRPPHRRALSSDPGHHRERGRRRHRAGGPDGPSILPHPGSLLRRPHPSLSADGTHYSAYGGILSNTDPGSEARSLSNTRPSDRPPLADDRSQGAWCACGACRTGTTEAS